MKQLHSCTYTWGPTIPTNIEKINKSPQKLRQTHDTVMSSTNEASQHGVRATRKSDGQENHNMSSASSADSCEHARLTARGDTCQEGMVRHTKARFGVRGHPKQKTTQPHHSTYHDTKAEHSVCLPSLRKQNNVHERVAPCHQREMKYRALVKQRSLQVSSSASLVK